MSTKFIHIQRWKVGFGDGVFFFNFVFCQVFCIVVDLVFSLGQTHVKPWYNIVKWCSFRWHHEIILRFCVLISTCWPNSQPASRLSSISNFGVERSLSTPFVLEFIPRPGCQNPDESTDEMRLEMLASRGLNYSPTFLRRAYVLNRGTGICPVAPILSRSSFICKMESRLWCAVQTT